MDRHVYPNEKRYEEELDAGGRWQPPAVLEELKKKARAEELWNLFLPESKHGAGLTNLEYAPLCEIMGRVHWASEVFNCSAPDTGNMEVLDRYGTEAQKREWLEPLLEGTIRSCFAMTEPRGGLLGRHQHREPHRAPRRPLRHQRPQVVVVVRARPALQALHLHGQDRPQEPGSTQAAVDDHCSARREGREGRAHPCRCSASTMPRKAMARCCSRTSRCRSPTCCWARAAASRSRRAVSGPGRIHHTMRAIGQAEVALEKMCRRVQSRVAFGKPIAEQTVTLSASPEARIAIEQARLLVLKAADKMDKFGNKAALAEIAMIKVAAPAMLCRVLDWAIQAHGGAGVTDDFGLAAGLCIMPAPCASSTAPTRCIATRSADWSCASTHETVRPHIHGR